MSNLKVMKNNERMTIQVYLCSEVAVMKFGMRTSSSEKTIKARTIGKE